MEEPFQPYINICYNSVNMINFFPKSLCQLTIWKPIYINICYNSVNMINFFSKSPCELTVWKPRYINTSCSNISAYEISHLTILSTHRMEAQIYQYLLQQHQCIWDISPYHPVNSPYGSPDISIPLAATSVHMRYLTLPSCQLTVWKPRYINTSGSNISAYEISHLTILSTHRMEAQIYQYLWQQHQCIWDISLYHPVNSPYGSPDISIPLAATSVHMRYLTLPSCQLTVWKPRYINTSGSNIGAYEISHFTILSTHRMEAQIYQYLWQQHRCIWDISLYHPVNSPYGSPDISIPLAATSVHMRYLTLSPYKLTVWKPRYINTSCSNIGAYEISHFTILSTYHMEAQIYQYLWQQHQCIWDISLYHPVNSPYGSPDISIPLAATSVHMRYRTLPSCQLTVWKPRYINTSCSNIGAYEISHFTILSTHHMEAQIYRYLWQQHQCIWDISLYHPVNSPYGSPDISIPLAATSVHMRYLTLPSCQLTIWKPRYINTSGSNISAYEISHFTIL